MGLFNPLLLARAYTSASLVLTTQSVTLAAEKFEPSASLSPKSGSKQPAASNHIALAKIGRHAQLEPGGGGTKKWILQHDKGQPFEEEGLEILCRSEHPRDVRNDKEVNTYTTYINGGL